MPYIKDNKRINIYAPFSTEDVRGIDLTDAGNRQRYGVTWLEDPLPPEDYTNDTHFRTEQDDAPYVVFTRKSDTQIDLAHNEKIKAKIDRLEAKQGRAVREAALGQVASLQVIETKIQALRAQLRSVQQQQGEEEE